LASGNLGDVKLPTWRLRAEPVSASAAESGIGLRFGDPEVGFRHSIGGEPSFDPGEVPTCSSCSGTMTFYGQLDSMNDQVLIADAGLILVYLCFDCFEAKALVASA
jgi:hypothetical protein